MELLYALESIRTPFLDKLMGLVTNLGGEAVFIVTAIVVFWCLKQKLRLLHDDSRLCRNDHQSVSEAVVSHSAALGSRIRTSR